MSEVILSEVVEDRAKLDALWLGSVVLSEGVAYQRFGSAEWAGEGCWYDSSQIPLPAKVLHNPKTGPAK